MNGTWCEFFGKAGIVTKQEYEKENISPGVRFGVPQGNAQKKEMCSLWEKGEDDDPL